jgi:hypothetical protein
MTDGVAKNAILGGPSTQIILSSVRLDTHPAAFVTDNVTSKHPTVEYVCVVVPLIVDEVPSPKFQLTAVP